MVFNAFRDPARDTATEFNVPGSDAFLVAPILKSALNTFTDTSFTYEAEYASATNLTEY